MHHPMDHLNRSSWSTHPYLPNNGRSSGSEFWYPSACVPCVHIKQPEIQYEHKFSRFHFTL